MTSFSVYLLHAPPTPCAARRARASIAAEFTRHCAKQPAWSTRTPAGETIGPHEIPMEPKALLEEAEGGGFWSYMAGVPLDPNIRESGMRENRSW